MRLYFIKINDISFSFTEIHKTPQLPKHQNHQTNPKLHHNNRNNPKTTKIRNQPIKVKQNDQKEFQTINV